MKGVVCRLALLILWSVVGVSAALAVEIPAEDFWTRLRQSDNLLRRALEASGSEREVALAEMTGLWADVTQVRYSDGTLASVDVRWLTDDLSNNEAQLNMLRARIAALLAYEEARGGEAAHSGAALNSLDSVLADDRFQYPAATPTAVPFRPTPIPRSPSTTFSPPTTSPVLGQLAQFALIAGGIAAVAVALFYLARGLRIQPNIALVESKPEDDPETAHEARARAAQSEAVTDYRAAIRYLYLASLLLLDERGLIHYDRALTNREHLRQLADQPQLVKLLRPVIDIFERVWYGFMPADEALYQQFRRYVDRLHQLEARR